MRNSLSDFRIKGERLISSLEMYVWSLEEEDVSCVYNEERVEILNSGEGGPHLDS